MNENIDNEYINPFLIELKKNSSSYYFWYKYGQHNNSLNVFLGTVIINNNSDYQLLIEQILNDLIFKCQEELCFMKFFHDLDADGKDILHFLLIIDITQKDMLKKTLLHAVSKLNNIDNSISNYKEVINHYLEYIDIYQYQRVKIYQI